MDTAWIQVFVLTISECVAPAGKTVCQEQQMQLQFLTRSDCEAALEQMLVLKEESERVIVNRDQSSCTSTARKREVWKSIGEADAALANSPGWQAPAIAESEADFQQSAHERRLADVPECSADKPVFPCRQGTIIVEEPASRKVEVWRREPDER